MTSLVSVLGPASAVACLLCAFLAECPIFTFVLLRLLLSDFHLSHHSVFSSSYNIYSEIQILLVFQLDRSRKNNLHKTIKYKLAFSPMASKFISPKRNSKIPLCMNGSYHLIIFIAFLKVKAVWKYSIWQNFLTVLQSRCYSSFIKEQTLMKKVVHLGLGIYVITAWNLSFHPCQCSMQPANPFPPFWNFPLCSLGCLPQPLQAPASLSSSPTGIIFLSFVAFSSRHWLNLPPSTNYRVPEVALYAFHFLMKVTFRTLLP